MQNFSPLHNQNQRVVTLDQREPQPLRDRQNNAMDLSDTARMPIPISVSPTFVNLQQQQQPSQINQVPIQSDLQSTFSKRIVNQQKNIIVPSQLSWKSYVNVPYQLSNLPQQVQPRPLLIIESLQDIKVPHNYNIVHPIIKRTPSQPYPILIGPLPEPCVDQMKRKEYEDRQLQQYLHCISLNNECYLQPPPKQILPIHSRPLTMDSCITIPPNLITEPIIMEPNFEEERRRDEENRRFQEYLFNFKLSNEAYLLPPPQQFQQIEQNLYKQQQLNSKNQGEDPLQSLQNYINANSANSTIPKQQKQSNNNYQRIQKENEEDVFYDDSKSAIPFTEAFNYKITPKKQQQPTTPQIKEENLSVKATSKIQNSTVIKQLQADDDLPRSEISDDDLKRRSQQSFYSNKFNRNLESIQEEWTQSRVIEQQMKIQQEWTQSRVLEQQQTKLQVNLPQLPNWKAPTRSNLDYEMKVLQQYSNNQFDLNQLNEKINNQHSSHKKKLEDQNQKFIGDIQNVLDKYDSQYQ